jgi:hypothetical protein
MNNFLILESPDDMVDAIYTMDINLHNTHTYMHTYIHIHTCTHMNNFLILESPDDMVDAIYGLYVRKKGISESCPFGCPLDQAYM